MEPIALEITRVEDGLALSMELLEDLPKNLESTLSSGATAVVDYPVRVYGRRRFFPDRKIWKGIARVSVNFDAVTGRYLCQLIVNGDTTASREVDTVEEARTWLIAPPAVEIPIPKSRRGAILRVRVRAVFASGTTWLVFPTTDGTEWREVRLEPVADETGE
jgi:hypothetical protein